MSPHFYFRIVMSATIVTWKQSSFVFILLFVVVGSYLINVVDIYLRMPKAHVQSDFHTTWCLCHLTVTRRASLVVQELWTLPEPAHEFTPCAWFGLCFSSVSCPFFAGHCSYLCSLSFGHGAVCHSAVCGFWTSFWYLQYFLTVFMFY